MEGNKNSTDRIINDEGLVQSSCMDISQLKKVTDEEKLKIQKLLKLFYAPVDRYEEAKSRYLELKNKGLQTPAIEAETKEAYSNLEIFLSKRNELEAEFKKQTGYNIETVGFILQLEYLRNAGLDPESLKVTAENMKEILSIKMAGVLEPEDVYGTVSGNEYLPLASLISKLFDGQFEGKTIVEIGPGDVGMVPLSYFAAKGANSVGVEPVPYKNDLMKVCGVKLIKAKWQDLSRIMAENKVDVVYFHWMTPVPEVGSGLEDREFREKIVEEMDKVLKRGGVIVQQNVENDYYLGCPAGYKKTYFRDITPDMNDRSDIDDNVVKKYDEARRAVGGKSFIHPIEIYQKP